MGKRTKDEEGIDFICERMGFDPKVVYELTKMMLEQYSRSVAAGKVVENFRSEEELLETKRQMRKDFLVIMKQPIDESRETQKKLLFQISEYKWLSDLKDFVLDAMEEYGEYGPIYRKILEFCYMVRKRLTHHEIVSEIGLSPSTITNKKREAIKLFGIYSYRLAALRDEEDIEK